MKLKKCLKSMTAIGLGAVIAGTALADAPTGAPRVDVFGDRMINLPMDESTVANKSVDVYYVHIPGAYGYTYDLVGSGAAPAADACDGTNPADIVLERKGVIMADANACASATTGTNPGQGDSNAGSAFGGPAFPFNGPVHLCKHTLADLPDGNYALAINPLMIGEQTTTAQSFQEARRANNCRPDDDDGNIFNLQGAPISGLDSPYMINALRDNVQPSEREHDNNYQLFSVADASPPPTVAPNAPDLELPLFNAQYNGFFTFEDDSGDAGAANWYQLWIEDSNGVRITDFDHNPVGGGWFNVEVDTGEITCVLNNATGKRVCTVQVFNSPTLLDLFAPGHSANDKLRWWVRGWNKANGTGHPGPWSATGQFIGQP